MKMFLIVATSMLFVGCTQKVHLGYTPVCEFQGHKEIALNNPTVKDRRVENEKLGAMRNLFWMPIIKITTDDSVPEWVENALSTELKNVGYTLSESSKYSIHGEVQRLSVNTHFLYHGRLGIQLQLIEKDQVVFEKTYLTKNSAGTNWAAQASTCVRTLEMNLQSICKQFIDDLNDHLAASV